MTDSLRNIEALIFDVFGTVVDWRGSVSASLRDLNPSLDEGKMVLDLWTIPQTSDSLPQIG